MFMTPRAGMGDMSAVGLNPMAQLTASRNEFYPVMPFGGCPFMAGNHPMMAIGSSPALMAANPMSMGMGGQHMGGQHIGQQAMAWPGPQTMGGPQAMGMAGTYPGYSYNAGEPAMSRNKMSKKAKKKEKKGATSIIKINQRRKNASPRHRAQRTMALIMIRPLI